MEQISSSLGMHKKSHTISKTKPKIRIIHIFAPEIIKTDAANFRELVQRLTGKPSTDDQNPITSCTKKKPRVALSRNKEEPRIKKINEMAMMRAGFHAGGCTERIKGEEEIWRGANTGGGFLGAFQELDQFPFMEGTAQMDHVNGEYSQVA